MTDFEPNQTTNLSGARRENTPVSRVWLERETVDKVYLCSSVAESQPAAGSSGSKQEMERKAE